MSTDQVGCQIAILGGYYDFCTYSVRYASVCFGRLFDFLCTRFGCSSSSSIRKRQAPFRHHRRRRRNLLWQDQGLLYGQGSFQGYRGCCSSDRFDHHCAQHHHQRDDHLMKKQDAPIVGRLSFYKNQKTGVGQMQFAFDSHLFSYCIKQE